MHRTYSYLSPKGIPEMLLISKSLVCMIMKNWGESADGAPGAGVGDGTGSISFADVTARMDLKFSCRNVAAPFHE